MRVTSFEITMTILAAVWAALIILDRRKHRRQQKQFRRDYRAGVAAGGRDTLDTLIDATREKPHESYTWGPGSDEPVPYALETEAADLALWEAEIEPKDAP